MDIHGFFQDLVLLFTGVIAVYKSVHYSAGIAVNSGFAFLPEIILLLCVTFSVIEIKICTVDVVTEILAAPVYDVR